MKWLVVANQPFTVIDNPQFRDLIAFLRPHLKTKMIHSTQLREKLDQAFADSREQFKKLIKVSRFHCILQRLRLTISEVGARPHSHCQ